MLQGYNPGKVRCRSCRIKGVDARVHVMCIKVYEDMCKSYITAQLTITDSVNFINELKLKSQDPISFSFDGGTGKVYEQQQYILGIHGEEQADNMRTMIYTIDTAGANFFKDRASYVQRSDVNMSGTSIASAIHGEYLENKPLRILGAAVGMLAKDSIGGFSTPMVKPIDAIERALKQSKFGFTSQTPVYFRDAEGFVIAPIEQLLTSAPVVQEFWQRTTWGDDWRHTFGGGSPPSMNAIVAATTILDENGRGDGAASASGNMSHAVFDISKAEDLVKKLASMGGAMMSNFGIDTRRGPASTNPAMDAPAINAFQQSLKDKVHYYVKVPIQSGIFCTVGTKAKINLLPPVGDLRGGSQTIGGPGLIPRLCHEVWFIDKPFQAWTTFEHVA